MSDSVHKTELSRIVAERLEISQSAAADATTTVLDCIAHAHGKPAGYTDRIRYLLGVGEGCKADARDSRRERGRDDRCSRARVRCVQG